MIFGVFPTILVKLTLLNYCSSPALLSSSRVLFPLLAAVPPVSSQCFGEEEVQRTYIRRVWYAWSPAQTVQVIKSSVADANYQACGKGMPIL